MADKRIPKYKIGDKVQLNVGGPKMSVKEIVENHNGKYEGNYKCMWFAGKKLEWGVFPEDSLVELDENTELTPRHSD